MFAPSTDIGITTPVSRLGRDDPVHLVTDCSRDQTIVVVLVPFGGIPRPDINQIGDPLVEIHDVRFLKREGQVDLPIVDHLNRDPVIIRQIKPDPIDLCIRKHTHLRTL